MFHHFTFNKVAPPAAGTDKDQEETTTTIVESTGTSNMACLPLTGTNVNETLVISSTPPEVETFIFGHKLTYSHEDFNEPHEGLLQVPRNEELICMDESATGDQDLISHVPHDSNENIGHDDDDGSILSVELDDISGSILDNLPSTGHNDTINSSSADDNDGIMDGPNPPNTEFIFHPIVQAMQEKQNEPKNTVLVDDDDSDDDDILLFAPSLQRRFMAQQKKIAAGTTNIETFPSNKVVNSNELVISLALPQPTTTQESSVHHQQQQEHRTTTKHLPVMNRMLNFLCFFVAFIALWWLSKYVIVMDDVNEVATMTESTNAGASTKTNPLQELSIPIPSPVTVFDTIVPNEVVDVPTIMLMRTITDTILDDIMLDDGNKVNPTILTSSTTTITRDVMSWSQFLWLSRRLFDCIVAIRNLPSIFYQMASMMIYLATVAATACVVITLLAKFAYMTWNKANIPEGTKQTSKTETLLPPPKPVDTAPDTLANSKHLREFIQSTQFSRTGRRSRTIASKAIKVEGYNTDSYELLSVDDLKCIAKFLNVPKVSKLQQKRNLINAIVAQYEASLQSFDVTDIKKILSMKEVDYKKTSNKVHLVKLAIEVGF